MRSLFIAALGFACVAASAAASEWSDATAKLTFDVPEGWQTARAPAEGMVYVVARNDAQECHVIEFQRQETAEFNPTQIQAASRTPITAEAWSRIPSLLPAVFGANSALTSSSVEDQGTWAIQTADFNSDGRAVHAGIQFRPGLELWAFCTAKSGPDQPDLFDGVIRSVATVDDPRLATEIEAAARAARQRADQNSATQRSSFSEDSQEIAAQRAGALLSGE